MKVIFMTNSFSHVGGGLVGAASGLARGVSDFGHDVVVSAYAENEATANIGGPWFGLRCAPLHARRFGGVHFGGNLRRVLEAETPDLTQVNGLWLRMSADSHRWCKQRNVPYLISPHGMLDEWAVRNSGWKKKLAGYWFEYVHLNDAACLHALCQSEADSIRKFGQKNPVCVIPNGVDLPPVVGGSALCPWNQSYGRKALLFMGRIHPKKGLPLLLSAWALLKETLPEVKDSWFIAIAGWSEVGHQAELEEQVRELCLHGDVEFLGPLHGEFKASAFGHASAFILPSYSEGLPMSVLEAWSYKLPSLITPECNLPEGFDSDAAICIEADVDSIVAGLIEVFEMSDGQRAEIGQRAYRLVESKFTWPEIAKQMVEVYEWILGGGDAPSSVRFI